MVGENVRMAGTLFEDEYKFARSQIIEAIFQNRLRWVELASLDGTAKYCHLARVIRAIIDLPLVLNHDGFNVDRQAVLQNFRFALAVAAGQPNSSEYRVLKAAFGFVNNQSFASRARIVQQIAAAKFLRHCYCVSHVGAQVMWVVSRPRSYKTCIATEIWDVRMSNTGLRTKVNDIDERCDFNERRKIALAVQNVKNCCRAAQLNIAYARGARNQNEIDRIERWFGVSRSDRHQFDQITRMLDIGYSRMSQDIERNRLIFTAHPVGGRGNGGYTYVHPNERLDVIYLHDAFFETDNVTVQRYMSWPIAILHEVARKVLKLRINPQADLGMRMRPLFKTDDAIQSPRSWAYYAADCHELLGPQNVRKLLDGSA